MNTDDLDPFALARQGEDDAGIDTLPISDAAKARLRSHLEAFAALLLEQFPDYDFTKTELYKRSEAQQ